MSNSTYKFAWPAPRQIGGDDGYQYVVFVNGYPKLEGLTRFEVSYCRLKFENEERAKAGLLPYEDPGPSFGTRLRELGFDKTAYDRKTKIWTPKCSKCNPRFKGTAVSHQPSCRNVPAYRKKWFLTHPGKAWTELGA